MAPRVRAAASACLVASGLLMSGLGGAIALADPGQGRSDDRKGSDDRTGDDSIGDIVRRAFGMDDGSGEKASEPRKRPDTRWGNGRGPWHGPGEQEPTKTDTSPTKTDTSPTKTTTPCPPTTKPTTPSRRDNLDRTRSSRNQVAVAAALSSSCRATSRRRCPICSCPVNYSLPSPECPVGPPRSRRAQVLWVPWRPSVPRCRSRCR